MAKKKEPKTNSEIHAALEKIKLVQDSEAYLYLQEVLFLELESRWKRLLESRLPKEDEHDLLESSRTIYGMISMISNEEISLRSKLFAIQTESESMKREKFRLRNEEKVRRIEKMFGMQKAYEQEQSQTGS